MVANITYIYIYIYSFKYPYLMLIIFKKMGFIDWTKTGISTRYQNEPLIPNEEHFDIPQSSRNRDFLPDAV